MLCILGLYLLKILSLVQVISWIEKNRLLGICQTPASLRPVSTEILHNRPNLKEIQLLLS